MSSIDVKSYPFWVGFGTVTATTCVVVFLLYKYNKNNPGRSSPQSSSGKVTLLDPSTKYKLKLKEKVIVSHNTRLFRFELPSPQHRLGVPSGQHIYVSAHINGQLVVRTYSPVSSDDILGHVDLIVKVYFKNVHPKFPDGGKMSQYLNDLPIGETVDFRGPAGNLVYTGKGQFAIKPDKKSKPNIIRVKKVNMIAGGSGITPMLQIIKSVFKDPTDSTDLSILFANQTESDILCRDELEELQRNSPSKFKLWYTLSQPPQEGWAYSKGHVNTEMLKDNLFPPSDDTIVLMCGPGPMINSACIPSLDQLSYSDKLRYVY